MTDREKELRQIIKGRLKEVPARIHYDDLVRLGKAELKGIQEGKKIRDKEVLKIIDEEPVHPNYKEFKIPAEAITQFKIKLKKQINKK